METQLINLAKSRTQMECLLFDIDCLWLLREPRQDWDAVRQSIARQIESGDKLICQGANAVISLAELAEVLQHEQHGYAFGTTMAQQKWRIDGAREAIRQLNFAGNPVRVDAEVLRNVRLDLGLSQAQFGVYLGGVPYRTVQDWEAGISKVPVTVAEILRLKGRLQRPHSPTRLPHL